MSNEGASVSHNTQRKNPNVSSSSCNDNNDSAEGNELRLVLLGRTGVGKSATGNTVLGKKSFDADLSMSSVTKECRSESETVEGRKITVIDTPDFCYTDFTFKELRQEANLCLASSSPGPHAFLLVIPIERYTEEQKRTVELILEMFNEEITRHTILIFSHADKLGGENIREFISRQKQPIRELVERFGRRLVAFDNTNPQRDQVKRLLEEVEKLLEQNQNQHFSNEIMKDRTEEKGDAKMVERQKKIKKEVRKLADFHWSAFSASLNEEKKETERKKQCIQLRIDQIEEDIKKEKKNAQPIEARLLRFRSSLMREQKNMRRVKKRETEEDEERREREEEEEKNLKIWMQEEEKRRLMCDGRLNRLFYCSMKCLKRLAILLLGIVIGLVLAHFLNGQTVKSEEESKEKESACEDVFCRYLWNKQ